MSSASSTAASARAAAASGWTSTVAAKPISPDDGPAAPPRSRCRRRWSRRARRVGPRTASGCAPPEPRRGCTPGRPPGPAPPRGPRREAARPGDPAELDGRALRVGRRGCSAGPTCPARSDPPPTPLSRPRRPGRAACRRADEGHHGAQLGTHLLDRVGGAARPQLLEAGPARPGSRRSTPRRRRPTGCRRGSVASRPRTCSSMTRGPRVRSPYSAVSEIEYRMPAMPCSYMRSTISLSSWRHSK